MRIVELSIRSGLRMFFYVDNIELEWDKDRQQGSQYSILLWLHEEDGSVKIVTACVVR